MLGGALAVGCRRIGAGPALTLSLSLVALAYYVVIVFQAQNTFYLLPTPGAAAGINRALQQALDASQIDFAPVQVREGYVILVAVAMWLVTTLGEVATFRWHRPLAASAAPIGLFALAMVVGTKEGSGVMVLLFISTLLTFWGLESSYRLHSWGRWITAWQSAPDAEPITGRVARRMGVTALAAALVTPALVPALGNGLFAWRASTGDGPGFGSGGSPSPIVDLKPQLVDQTTDELFRVHSASPTYWRAVSLSEFDGRLWSRAEARNESLQGGRIVAGPQNPALDRELVQDFELTELGGPFLPAGERPTAVEGADEEIEVNAETLHLEASDGDVSEMSYRVRSLTTELTFNEMTNADIGDLGERYRALPSETSPRVIDLASTITAGIDSAFERLVALQEFFQGGEFRYNINVDPPRSDDFLEEFLFDTRTGYCQQFATAFAVLSRALGYPTRVSVGYLTGTPDPEEADTYVVRGRQTHAWPEVYFQEYGWVRFEPTPRDIAQDQLPYTIDPDEPRIANNPAEADLQAGGQAARANVQAGAQQGTCQNVQGAVAEQCNRRAAGRNPTGQNDGRRAAEGADAWRHTFAVILRVLGAAALLFLAAVPLLKELRTRRRYRRSGDDSEATAAAFQEFLDDARELAFGKLAAESPTSYVVRLRRDGRIDPRTGERLAVLFERAMFSVQGANRGEAIEARRLARSLRTGLWRRASWWSRSRRLFSPVGLTGITFERGRRTRAASGRAS